MKVTYKFVVDLARPSKTNTIIMSENDNDSREVLFVLTADKKPFDMSDVKHVTLRAVHGSGSNTAIYDEDITNSIITETTTDEDDNETIVKTNEILYLVPGFITGYAGTTTVSITLYGEDKSQLTSFEWYMCVRSTLHSTSDDEEVSDDDVQSYKTMYLNLKQMIDDISTKLDKTEYANPEALRIVADGVTYDYKGNEAVEITFGNIAYLDSASSTTEDAIDESLISEAKNYADSAATSSRNAQAASEYAQEVYSRANDIYQAIDGQYPTISATKNTDTGITTIAITQMVNGTPTTSTVQINDGVSGDGTAIVSYNSLTGLPIINGVELKNAITLAQLGVAASSHTHTSSDVTDLSTTIGNAVPTITASKSGDTATIIIKKSGQADQVITIKDGDQGEAGIVGNKWYYGDQIDADEDDEASSYIASGITNANVGDAFLNTTNGKIFSCTLGGNPSTAKWVYQYQITSSGDGSSSSSSGSLLATGSTLFYLNGTQIKYGTSSTNDYTATTLGLATTGSLSSLNTIVTGIQTDLTTKSTTGTLAAYGINDAYTKNETDSVIGDVIAGVKQVNSKLTLKINSLNTSAVDYDPSSSDNVTYDITVPIAAQSISSTDTSRFVTPNLLHTALQSYATKLDITNMQTTGNLKTSVTDSDSEYPSCKAVKTYVSGIVGDIVTALDSL